MNKQNIMILATMAKLKIRDFFTDERGEVNIVTIVVLIGIAVLLAVVFKEQIEDLLKTLFETIKGTAGDAIKGEGGN